MAPLRSKLASGLNAPGAAPNPGASAAAEAAAIGRHDAPAGAGSAPSAVAAHGDGSDTARASGPDAGRELTDGTADPTAGASGTPAPPDSQSTAPSPPAAGPSRRTPSKRARRSAPHVPSLNVPSRAAVESAARELLSAPVEAARHRLQNPRELSDRIAMGRAIWRELVVGFAAQLGELRLGFTQLAAMYALADSGTMTIADLADTLGRSPSAVSRLVDTLVRRQLLERHQDAEDRRQRTLGLTGRGQALLGLVDRARAEQFLSVVRPLPAPERALVAMGVAALSTHAISRRGRLIKQRAE